MNKEEIFFSRELSARMKEADVRQVELSKAVGVRQSQVSNWLNGLSLPGYLSLAKLSAFFNVSIETFFDIEKTAEAVNSRCD
jgi:transcriptional regulator with XRE-family HTH domain